MEPLLQQGFHFTIRRLSRDLTIIPPAQIVHGGHPVGMILMPAVQANEPVPVAVFPIHITTRWTGLRTLRRIDLLVTETFRQRLKFYTYL